MSTKIWTNVLTFSPDGYLTFGHMLVQLCPVKKLIVYKRKLLASCGIFATDTSMWLFMYLLRALISPLGTVRVRVRYAYTFRFATTLASPR